MMKVLLPIAQQPASLAAAKAALRKREWPAGTELTLLTVVKSASAASVLLTEETQIKRRLEHEEHVRHAQTTLNELKQFLDYQGFEQVACRVDSGADPADEIIEIAIEQHSDLIICGAQNKSVVERLVLGSTAAKVAERAPCSVEILKNVGIPEGVCSRVLIAFDFSDHSNTILDHLIRLRWADAVQFHLVTVLPKATELLAQAATPLEVKPLMKQSEEAKLRAERSLLEYRLHLMQRTKVRDISVEVAEGEPADGIINTAESWQATLVVVGTRGHSGLKRLFLGSVAGALVNRCPCSVHVVRKVDHHW